MTEGVAGVVAFVVGMTIVSADGVAWIDDPAKIPPELVTHPVVQQWLKTRIAIRAPVAVVPRYWDVDEGRTPKRLDQCEPRARITISYNNGTGQPWLRFCTESASLRWINEEGEGK